MMPVLLLLLAHVLVEVVVDTADLSSADALIWGAYGLPTDRRGEEGLA